MRKLLFSLAAILVLLVLVSCPDGMIPTSVLDIALTMSEDSEIKLEQFEKLNYTVKEVESGKEITQEFSTIENIKVPVVTTGEYVISVTGVTEDDNYTYTCSGSETVTVTENQATKVEIVLKTTKVVKEATISLSFDNKIEKSEEYDLEIATIDCLITSGGEQILKIEGGKFTDNKTLEVSVPYGITELEYSVSAKNKDNVLIGEGSGTINIEETESYSIPILEKAGKGTLVVSITKERDALFLPVIIGGVEYPVKAVGDSATEGSVSIPLQSGNYTVSICGREVAVRIVSEQVRNINYNYATPLLTVTLRDRIDKSEDHDLDIAKIDYSFPDFEEKYSGTGVNYTENLNIQIPKINGSFEYRVIAYNKEGTIIGEGIGSLTIDDDTKISAILIKEKTGNATIKFELTKNADENFPTISVGNDNVTITVSKDKTKGSGSFTVQNGTHSIYVGSKKVDEVRLVYGEEKVLPLDLTEYWLHLSFVDKINKENADGLNLDIATLELTFKDGEREFSIYPKSFSIRIANSDYILNVKAKNSDGVVIGEGSGKFPLDDGLLEYTVEISEIKGDGTLVVNGLKDSVNQFPSITIGDDTYEFTEESDSSTNGTRSITLKNGFYTVVCDGKEKTVRIAAGQTNTLEFDFRNPAVIILKDGIPKYEGFDMDISSIRYSIKSLNNEECVYTSGEEKVDWTGDLEIPVSFVSGLWEYDIVAYNKDDIEIGEAKYAFLMKNNSPSISIEEKTGKGSANITLKFNSDVSNPSAYISEESIALVKEGDVWKANIEKDSGIYSLTIDGKEFALRIVNGFTTEFSEDLRYSIDVSVDNGITSSQEFTISLSPAGKNGEVSAYLSTVNGSIPPEAKVTWYLGSTEIGTGYSVIKESADVETGFYTLKAVVTKSSKVIGIAACVVEVKGAEVI